MLPAGQPVAHAWRSTTSTPRAAQDPLFHKESRWLQPLTTPPFVVLDLTLEKYPFWSAFTLGGLHTRPTGEVLDADGAVVPGLYAAGRNASGLPAHGYNSGLSLADATWSGRLAGARCGEGPALSAAQLLAPS